MNGINYIITILGAISCLLSCEVDESLYLEKVSKPAHLHKSQKMLTDVMVHDIFSPPVASRIYVYSSIAAYETMVSGNPGFISLAGQITDLDKIPSPNKGHQICFPVAAVHAYVTVGTRLIFSEDKMDDFILEMHKTYKEAGVPQVVLNQSKKYGEEVASHIIAWADKDNYKQTRTFPKYSIDEDPTRWQPTPPAYMDAVEPSWNKIRPFIMERADQFAPPPPTPFSAEVNSQFYKEAMEVYNLGNDSISVEEKKNIASFWDCNPFVSHFSGHVMFATKKISPGGHWIGITKLAAVKAKLNFIQTAEAYAWVSIGLADAFISCWDEKYRSELIRPETYINKYIDDKWMPTLQTPPFPEYTSGHSVASATTAEILTHLFGEDFEFEDTVEKEFGLPTRKYQSFKQAASEAAMSRLWGGIHYMPAIVNGSRQGSNLGSFIVKTLKTQK
ncbi:MAG: vanadium-dependent haloperoxidase [Saprospiraceae bacterium]|nr:vanadium-dependent haloperoxidase [Saprospiraceae bacterium]